jgi:hypothetical protein
MDTSNQPLHDSGVIESTSTHSHSNSCGTECIVSRQDGRLGRDDNNSSSKRTFKAFEERANAELVERALGDHDLDK